MTITQSSPPPSSAHRPSTSTPSKHPVDSSAADTEYLIAVQRMHAKQDAWSRAARSASASVSASDSPGGSGSRSLSPSKPGDGLYMSNSFSGSVGDAGGSGSAGPAKKGRKKVAKACLACQKSHVTCDDKRPCTRCVKKGMSEQCVEGVRKKAKYLLEEDEKLALEASQPAPHTAGPSTGRPSSSSSPHHILRHSLSPIRQSHISPDFTQNYPQPPPVPLPQPQPQIQPTSNLPPSLQPNPAQRSNSGMPDDIWLAPPLDGENGIGLSGVGDSRMWFGSGGMTLADNTGGTSTPFNTNGMTAATSEYAMLDSMFAMDPVFPGLGGLDGMDQPMPMDAQQFINPDWGMSSNSPQLFSSRNNSTAHAGSFSTSLPNPPRQQDQQQRPLATGTVLTAPPNFELPSSPWSTWLNNAANTNNGQMTGGAGMSDPTAAELLAASGGKKTMSSSEVYKTVTKPYDYTEGYHTLMEYLTTNFERKEILRVVHSLASYRPSLIALQMPMSEEDEVFLEKSFQRTLIELEKLISYSATPTAVWRRTGEVCYANPEFCSLVKRNENDLFGGKKNYIYRLFSKPSVIAYWENFSLHAFENTTQNFFQPTSLTLTGGNVDCSCCFTIRRDVFDLPSVIIGQFLPIPKDA